MAEAGPGAVITVGPVTEPSYYLVQAGDSLYGIAATLGVDGTALLAANGMTTPDTMEAGYLLRVPGPDGAVPAWAFPVFGEDGTMTVAPRKGVAERMTPVARAARPDSPFYKRTWLTYYGRPNIPVMGILGEHDVVTLTQLLKEKAAEYDRVNGPALAVQPAIHLVHGMATVGPGEDNSYLAYLTDAELLPYIEHALQEDVAVILDVQVANLSPAEAISRDAAVPQVPQRSPGHGPGVRHELSRTARSGQPHRLYHRRAGERGAAGHRRLHAGESHPGQAAAARPPVPDPT